MTKTYGDVRLVIEAVNICNLRCSYCFRDDQALYHEKAVYLPIEFLRKLFYEAREVGVSSVSLTGGEATLHPQFAEIIKAANDHSLKFSFVTNGWHFERLWKNIRGSGHSINHIAFSLDGVTPEAHDFWRGNGSFVRLMQAFALCHEAQIPFTVKVILRRDTIDKIEAFALFCARMGAHALSFAHLFSVSQLIDEDASLTLEQRKFAEQEIALLAKILRMPVSLDVGYYNLNDAAPCSPLYGTSFNVNYRGQLTLCCNLSGLRGSRSNQDIIADLNQESFTDAVAKFRDLAQTLLDRRKTALVSFKPTGLAEDLTIASPCHFCAASLGKKQSHTPTKRSVSLPVLS